MTVVGGTDVLAASISPTQDNWTIYSPWGGSANWEETNDGLKFNGSGYRRGTLIESNWSGDLTQGVQARFKWQAHGGNGYNYSSFHVGVGKYDPVYTYLIIGNGGTTHHSFDGSHLIQSDTWYYTTIDIRPDRSVSASLATENYADSGGQVQYADDYTVNNSLVWSAMSDASLTATLLDNYGSTSTFMTLGEASFFLAEESVPEPLTILGSIAALGLVAALKRRQRVE